ncbi:MAG: hypothetical protein H7Z16_00510 [Pyrinomonadaceae bacterium]|nr:hypothetical protein [Pyrinomonadaceae bacterium]
MDDPKQERAESQKSVDELLEQRQSDATDDETLGEADQSRTKIDAGEDQGGGLSPDGALDESAEIKDAGPM